MKMIIPTFKAFTERKYYEAMLERDDWGEEKISVREWLDESEEFLREEYLELARKKRDIESEDK
jgi:hypothetical protein